MAQPVLRPFGVGEIIDVSFTILRRRFLQMIAIAAIITVPMGIAQVLTLPEFVTTAASFQSGEVSESDLEAFEELLSLDEILPFVIVLIVSFFLTFIATGALTSVVADEYTGTESTWRDSIRQGVRKMPRIVGAVLLLVLIYVGFVLAMVVIGAVIGPLVVLIVLVGVVFAAIAVVSVSLFIPALVVEGLSPWASLRRSWGLTRGRRGPILGTFLLAALITVILSTIVQTVVAFPFPASQQIAVSGVASVLVGMVTSPFFATVNAVIYFDQRVRKEGFDLDLLAAQMGTPLTAAAPLPPDAFAPPTTPVVEADPPTHGVGQTPVESAADARRSEDVADDRSSQGFESEESPERSDGDESAWPPPLDG